jgi:hypothetical protein
LAIAIVVPFQVPEVIVPTLVKLELTTVLFSVVPVSVPAGATTALPLAAVIKPLAFTVNEGIEVEDPKDPTFPFTVARVKTEPLVVASPDKAAAAVTNPFALTVTEAKVPILEFTVARVSAALPGPEAVASPVKAVI